MADFLCHPSKRTPVFVRFSTVLGFRGSADTVRDVRGFATKFYTDEGNFDLVGNNIPVFFIQDAIKFPDVVHAGKPEPHNELPQAQTAHDNFWDFISYTPESAHMIMWTLSDRAIPRSFRMMQGFGVHSFIMVNKEGKRRFVKFHWIPVLGTHSLVWDESQKLGGIDPDWHRRDLWDAIELGAFPEYELGLQIVEEEDEHKFDFDILDSTKIIPEEMVPVRRVGKMVLNRNPANFFAETEQVAYHTGHLVRGIEISNDPLLQGRMFSYTDTQLTRLGGPNFEEIPINRPICPVTNNQRDGFHRQTVNRGTVNYFPNRHGCPALASIQQGGYAHTPFMVHGPKIREKPPKFLEHYSQARLFYNSLSYWEKIHLIKAAQFELGKCDDLGVRERIVDMFNHIDFDLAVQVANAIGVTAPTESKALTHTLTSPAVSQDNTVKNSIQSRRIAYLVAPGYNGTQVSLLTAALGGLGAVNFVVGPFKGPVPSGSGPSATASFSFLTCKSIMFDAVVVVGGTHIDQLMAIGEAKAFICEAFKHCKPIAAIDEGVDFIAMQRLPAVQLAETEGMVDNQGVVTIRKFAESALKMGESGPISFGTALFNAIAAHRHHQRSVDMVAA
eukprot:GILK01013767.1.p1 GENE.GILK01013767.1~~GILK01013767.1.p1  ORF type:complete len:683 (+),score=111.10 GILK01013767.1:206-2050(+)